MSTSTLMATACLTIWFGLDFVGIAGVVDKEPILSPAGGMLVGLLLVSVAGTSRLPFVALVYAVSLLAWAVFQIETHWGTYLLFDADARKLAWYDVAFGANWRLLPLIRGRTTPDGYHTVLAALILANFILALRDLKNVGRRR